MRHLEGRGKREDGFDLDGGQSRGPTVVVRAARDAVKFPDDPTIVGIVEKAMCIGRLGENCYVIKNVYGDERAVPYGASLETWRLLTQELADIALHKALTP
jgi:hypothetical protein